MGASCNNNANEDLSDSENGSSSDSDHDDDMGLWSIVDGNCLLRRISRRVHGTPDLHDIVRTDIMHYIDQNIHNPRPNTDGLTFYETISSGITIESINIFGSSPITYQSVDHFIQFMSQPRAYATNIEMEAASMLYGVNFRVIHDGFPYPDPPNDNTSNLIYFPISLHYCCTLRYSPPL